MRYRRIRWLLALLLSTFICHAQTAIDLTDNGDGTWTLASMPTYNVQMAVEYEDDLSQAIDLTDNGNGTWTLASMPDYDVRMVVEYEDDLSQAIDLTDNGDGTWTLASMPDYDVRMVVEYEEDTDIDYNLWIAGTQVTSQNCTDVMGDGKVSYDVETNTLTLNGASIGSNANEGIKSQLAGLNINVQGLNIITADSEDGIYLHATGTATIHGNGSLAVSTQNGVGIHAYQNLVLKDGVNVTVSSKSSYGIRGSKLKRLSPYPTLTLQGQATMLTAKGGSVRLSGSVAFFQALTLSNGLEILEPEGAEFHEDVGIVNSGGTVATTQKVVIANQDYIDSIKTLSGSPLKGEGMYNLAGQKVGEGYKGIVIKDGKKILK